MRKSAWALLVLFVFAIPWEYSLDLGEPLGNIARILGLLLLVATIPAILQAGRIRTPGALQILALAFYLWFCCSALWTIDRAITLERLRGSFQVIMVVWLVWELAETPKDLRTLVHAYVAGAWVLAALTLISYITAGASGQSRFAPEGQDPNDTARFLDLALPMAALLYDGESRWLGKFLTLGYLPLGLLGVLLTASRGGFVGAFIALSGSAILLLRHRRPRQILAALCTPLAALALWLTVPAETFARLSTIYEQVQSGDLNRRLDIWTAAWHAFPQSPFVGFGAGTFVSAAGLAPMDTAHNTALSLSMEGGIVALAISVAILLACAYSALRTTGTLRIGLTAALIILAISALDATIEQNRTTWLLLSLIAFAGRLATEKPQQLAQSFPAAQAAIVECTLAEAAG